MEAIEKVRGIQRRIVLVGVVMLLAISTKANAIYDGSNPMKENMFVFYITGAMFFALFLVYLLSTRSAKSNNTLQPELKVVHVRRKHHHYKKVIKKTA